MKILGIDPGTATTGYGLIETRGGKLAALEYGCIQTAPKQTLEIRLAEIYQDLNKLIKKHHPPVIAVESLFFFKNVKTAIAVAQARGIVLLAARQHRLKLLEFTPLQVKQTLTSYGKAEKKQVQYMVKALLHLARIPKPDDAADALALAICAASKTVQ